MLDADSVGAVATVSCELTVITDDADDVADAGRVALSAALSSKLYEPVERVPPDMLQLTVFPESWPEPLFFAHCVAAT